MNTNTNKVDHDEDERAYDNLCKYSIEKCELCDMVFSSRFANMIHSSQHIIIPLLKQKIHQCKKCLHCFTSKRDLKAHKQDKHNKNDLKEDNDRQISYVESQIDQEVSPIDQEDTQISIKTCQIDHTKELDDKASKIIIDPKKSVTQNSHKRSQNDQKESQNSQNEIENEKDALLQSIIMKQPIVIVENIGNIFPKTLSVTKNDKKHTKAQKNTIFLEKDSPKTQKDKKNKEKDNAETQKDTKIHEKESFKTKKLDKEKEPPEIIFSSNRTSQTNITEIIPNKIIIGGKKPIKRKSADKTDNSLSKRDKKSTSTDTNKSEKDRQSEATVSNGIHTTDLTKLSRNRYRFDYRATSPDVVSVGSDSSNEPSSKNTLPKAAQSKRSLLTFTYEETISQKEQSKPVSQKDQSKTASQKGQSKNVPQKYQSKTTSQKDQSKTVQQNDWSKTLPQKDQSKTVQQNDWTKNLPQTDQTRTEQQNDLSKNITQKNQSINIPFVITDSDNELDANIDELLNNITSPIKKSNFRSKLQFEDDESFKMLDLDRELTNLSNEFKSVHYDELVEPEMSECQRCHMLFMNKLTLYQHEVTHMRFKRSKRHFFCKYCENYFAGNHFTQKKHFENVHNTAVNKKGIFPCPLCKLQYYKLKNHYKKFHPNLICRNCSTCFGTETLMNQHNCTKIIPELEEYDSKMTQKRYDLLLVCELCLSFTKNRFPVKYEVVGEKCEIGARQRCFYCAKEFFEVKVVKRSITSGRSQNLKIDLKVSEGKKKSQVTNAAKLQIIQKRLKAMKKL